MSEVPENYCETTEFEKELVLARLKGVLELAVDRFIALGEKIKEFGDALEQLEENYAEDE